MNGKKQSNFSNCVVIGTGYSVKSFFKNDNLNELAKVVCFQASFPNVIKEYNFYPDVWTWSDPHSALDGLNMIASGEVDENYNESNKLTILMPAPLGVSFLKDEKFRNYFGSSPVWRDKRLFYEYYGLLNLVKEKSNIDFISFPIYSQKQIVVSPSETVECNSIKNKPESRFDLSRPLIGSFEYEGNNTHYNNWGRENKLTSYVFPIMAHFGCRKLGVVGFDYGGSRFYDESKNVHAFQTGNFNDPIYKIVNIWVKKWQKYHKMDIYSLVEKGESGLNDILENA